VVAIRALVLMTTLVAVSPVVLAAPVATPVVSTAAPRKIGPLKRAYLKELAGWRSIFKKPARFFRFALTSGVSIGAGWLTNHLTGSPSAASFVSFSTGVLADRLIERVLPRSRPLGVARPPGLLRDTAQTLVGASVAAVATPVMMEVFQQAGSNAPALFGLGTQLVLARPLVQGAAGFAGSLLATGARFGLNKLFRLRTAAKSDDRDHG
jgi:hypothetical protein